ncbi:dicarboxylate--CoA ligase PimA [Novosphingobium marinum]|uniref:Long-chain-fatty-acid--CoA ligase n=1 Tax=Novosphingobium marinum TaxID=1514948 RepID=A0A7Y9XW88_9SPHN|nr:AMP-binding protein [Novosphingobium marinum]NYH95682.1 long-chain acyl-CoA synthetase [Novosphingobium marinum]GGC28997.1 dicarboxylate--CoA ligase PimA [Novosphingobium marinum]
MERTLPEPWRERYVHPCQWDQTFEPLTMTDLFAQAARKFGNDPLVDFYGRRYSYAEHFREARAFAAGLQARGIGRGDRVALFLPNVPIYVPAYFGVMIAGAVAVNFSPLYSAEELEAQVADSGARLMVTVDAASLLPTALKVLRNSALEGVISGSLPRMLPTLKGLAFRLFKRGDLAPIPKSADISTWEDALGDAEPAPADYGPDDLALLQYTGGTTGTPKGAMLTHQNLSANARQIEAVDPHRNERDMIAGVLPLFHIFANATVLNRTIYNGGCMALLPRFDAAQCLKMIERTRATSMPGVPTMYQALLDDPSLAGTDFTTLRTCISGGAPLPMPLKERFEDRTRAALIEGYGLTESGIVSTNPYEGGEKPGTIGQPLPGTRLRLLDKEDPSKDAAPGDAGELAISGPQVMLGYWNRPDTAAHAFAERDGERWLRTGDIARIDEDGFVRIVDRSKDMIAVGGFKVFPSQVEAVLVEHPAVKEALVIGVLDDYYGEMPRAFVTLQDAAGGEELRDWLNARVGKHERVDSVVVRESLPRTMVGKLDRKALRAEVVDAAE